MTPEKARDRAYFAIFDLRTEILDEQEVQERLETLASLPLYAVVEICDRERFPLWRVLDYVRAQQLCREVMK